MRRHSADELQSNDPVNLSSLDHKPQPHYKQTPEVIAGVPPAPRLVTEINIASRRVQRALDADLLSDRNKYKLYV